ncbi:hypothetical protein J3R30DRAFT_3700142 [Lentinula aciculospora]|uniref:Uncharacterized protein n=1 Tax=Lentinula aciculospora TaxID=153920 RepID=A0A9W9AGY9_9AGAR|nr:hypothetical protein J3R30DRAFT_3700142 [Lentinula aciculospora]
MNSSFSVGSWGTAGVGGGSWLGNTSTYIGSPGGDIVVSFQGTSISFTGNTPSSTNPPTWFLVGIDPDAPHFPMLEHRFIPNGIKHQLLLMGLSVTTPLSGTTIIVDDQSSEIVYMGNGWMTSDAELNIGGGWINGPPLGNTTHRTSTVGDGLHFQFSGSTLSVYGVFEWTATGSMGIDFTLDGETTSSLLFVPTGTSTSHTETPHYLFFSSGILQAGNHTLFKNVTQSDGNQSLIFDYLTYKPSFTSLSSRPNFTASASSRTDGSSPPSPSTSNAVAVPLTHKV